MLLCPNCVWAVKIQGTTCTHTNTSTISDILVSGEERRSRHTNIHTCTHICGLSPFPLSLYFCIALLVIVSDCQPLWRWECRTPTTHLASPNAIFLRFWNAKERTIGRSDYPPLQSCSIVSAVIVSGSLSRSLCIYTCKYIYIYMCVYACTCARVGVF